MASPRAFGAAALVVGLVVAALYGVFARKQPPPPA
jgi:hypothetical protein